MTGIELIGIAVLGLCATVGSSIYSGPMWVIPALFTRRARKRYRDWAGDRDDQMSGRVPRWLWAMTGRADRWHCVACGAKRGAHDPRSPRWKPATIIVQADHVVPFKLGGLTAFINMALLCRHCNAVKSCLWIAPNGKVYYRGRGEPPQEALDILAAERRALRRWPIRWARAFRLLPAW
jgi:5-methylcytosine-specific restriction endonuclease McrA